MNHGSLFSGIGGFDLAAEWSGFTNIFNCEWEEFPRKVLKHHFPKAKQHENIKDFNATQYHGRIEILSGGFPCQPFSTAGLRKGTEDERHLWPEMLRVIRECNPRWVVGENVRGLVSWSNGLVLETCYSDLENLGYSVQSFIIPACSTGAPHRRDRVWIVAHRERVRLEYTEKPGSLEERREKTRFDVAKPIETNGERRNAPDTDSERLFCNRPVERGEEGERRNPTERGNNIEQIGSGHTDYPTSNKWENFPTQPPICGGDDGLPKELDGITFSKWRKESIKAYGNAIVPQVAFRIFESIKQYENDQY